jgi:hypothetical protein
MTMIARLVTAGAVLIVAALIYAALMVSGMVFAMWTPW